MSTDQTRKASTSRTARSAPGTYSRGGKLAMPKGDRRGAEWQLVDRARVAMEKQLGDAPSFELVQAGETVLRLRFEIGRLARKRAQDGDLSQRDAGTLARVEGALARALRHWTRLVAEPTGAPAPHDMGWTL